MSGPEVIIIKKKNRGHGAHGAAWKVAYADFVTAMMALFMVLWLVSQTDQQIKKSLSEYFRTGVFSGAPSLLEGGSGVGDRGFVDTADSPSAIEPVVLQRNAEAVRTTLSKAFQKADLKGLEDHVSVRVTENGILIQIAEGRDDMLFDLSSSDLKPALLNLLTQLAPTLSKLGYGLELHGHTDARPFPPGALKNNWTLSFSRADAARMELEKGGVPPEMIIGVYAHGSTQPIDKANPKSPANRRLSIFARALPHEEPSPDKSAKPSGDAPPKKGKRAPPEDAKVTSPGAEPSDEPPSE